MLEIEIVSSCEENHQKRLFSMFRVTPFTPQWSRFVESMYRPLDAASLVAFRIAFGALMLWEVSRYFAYGWINRYYIEPDFNFTYWGFEWVRPLSEHGMYVHFFMMGMFATLIMLGHFYRFGTIAFFLSFTYVFLLDQTRYLNHFYLISLVSFLMIFIPAHRCCSLDALRVPHIRTSTVPAWSVWILRFMIGVPYFYGGIAKLNMDWLCGEPLSLWIRNDTGFPIIGQYFTEKWMGILLSYCGLVFDLLIVPILLWKRTRVVGYCLVLVFNLTNAELFSIGVFPWFMIVGTTIFFEPNWPRRVLTWLRLLKEHRPEEPVSVATPWRCHFLAIFLVIFIAVQILLPFRHFLYPGSVHWTEEGHRFSWHMKLRSKRAKGTFLVRDSRSQREWSVDPNEFLTKKQTIKMAARPHLVLSFAHYLKDNYRNRGFEDVEIYANIRASLNGRKSQPMIDETVDLSKEKHSFIPKKWILPLTNPLR